MTKKEAIQYYKEYIKRVPPVDEGDRMFIAGMKHILVLLGVKHTELE